MPRKRYIRYGRLPENGISKIYNKEEVIGEEVGVSCWRAKYKNGRWYPCFPKKPTQFSLDDFSWMMQVESEVYLISGTKIAVGSDGEPVVKNAKICRRIKRYSRQEFDHIIPGLYNRYEHLFK
jgi:hypothetical protein